MEAGRLVAGQNVDLDLSFEGIHKVGGAAEPKAGGASPAKH